MVRSEKVEKQNRKNINAIITRETLREEKERVIFLLPLR